ncbi:hypothetical protein ABES02_00985 [Neobacillus pocheonensis]|uniref:hypothetical protein n=1 Tax=Neobacillus pocheonensis TaxID=363869 RepID=UPI003D2B63BC
MGRELGSIFNELKIVKDQELDECNKELTNENYSHIVKKALLAYKHELLENLEMYDHYLDHKRGTFF